MKIRKHHKLLLIGVFVLYAIGKMNAQTVHKNLDQRFIQLPSWISDFNHSSSDKPMIFGISDPGLCGKMAYEQASNRAFMLAQLFQMAEIGIYTTHFETMSENRRFQNLTGKYVRFFRIQNHLDACNFTLLLSDSMTTSYGEKVLLYDIHPSISVEPSESSLAITVDFLQTEFNRGKEYAEDSFYTFCGTTDSCLSAYRIYKTDEISEIESQFNGHQVVIPIDYYKYLPSDHQDTITSNTAFNGSAKLYYGLWKAYFEALVKSWTGYYAGETNIELVQETYSNKVLKLNQLTETKLVSAQLKAFKIDQNEIQIELDFQASDNY